jgi:hypothetical protein
MRGEPFTTGGVHLRSDPPFDVDNPHADWSFREIPTDADTADLAITHTHYNTLGFYVSTPGNKPPVPGVKPGWGLHIELDCAKPRTLCTLFGAVGLS